MLQFAVHLFFEYGFHNFTYLTDFDIYLLINIDCYEEGQIIWNQINLQKLHTT
jgi:hypothetical protein